jgi:REP element-mobilizing transposase RayT
MNPNNKPKTLECAGHDGALPLDCAGHDGALDGRDRSRPQQVTDTHHQGQSGDVSPHSKEPWPHAPPHWLFEPGVYMVTASTYGKTPFFSSPERLDLLLDTLFSCTRDFQWSVQAWALMANHYHFVARSPDDPNNLAKMLGKLHMQTARPSTRQTTPRDERSGTSSGTAISPTRSPISPDFTTCTRTRYTMA